jgi:hypothetical protein
MPSAFCFWILEWVGYLPVSIPVKERRENGSHRCWYTTYVGKFLSRSPWIVTPCSVMVGYERCKGPSIFWAKMEVAWSSEALHGVTTQEDVYLKLHRCDNLKCRCTLNRRLGGPQSRSGRMGEEKSPCFCWESNPGRRPAHSHSIDCVLWLWFIIIIIIIIIIVIIIIVMHLCQIIIVMMIVMHLCPT